MTSVTENSFPGGKSDSPTYWRSFAQLENSAEFQEIVAREFPAGADEAPDEVSRRGFLGAIAASVALAGMTSCRKPVTPIVAFNKRPEGFRPGMPQQYATALSRNGYGIGVLVRSSDGRPTKVDGNPAHPSSLGGSDLRLQAELLQLYDPARSRAARGPSSHSHGDHGHDDHGHDGHDHPEPDIWAEFYATWEDKLRSELDKQGEGLHFLLPATSSPSLLALIQKTKSAPFAKAQFHFWSPTHDDNELAGARMAFGRPVATQYDFAQADVVVSLDSDFLSTDGNTLANARGWAKTRREPVAGKKLSRLYVVESCFSDTGAAADHRFRMRAGDIPGAAYALAKALGVGNGDALGTELGKHDPAAFTKNGKNWLEAMARDLQSARGRCIVTAGARQPAAVHAVVHAINDALGNVGKTVTYRAVPEGMQQGSVASLQALKSELEKGAGIDTLICIGCNPALDAPAEFKFAELIAKAKLSVHVGDYDDETGRLCQWHFPLAHELEAWGDVRAHDGTITLQQPLIRPLHGGVSTLEFLAFLTQEPNYEGLVYARDAVFGHDLVKAHWQQTSGAVDFATWWSQTLHDGTVADSAYLPETPSLTAATIATGVRGHAKTAGIEIVLRRCPKMDGGRFANNSWMQEIPDPLTKLSWDNAALVSMATAATLGVENGDVLGITANGSTVEIPAWILPGLPDDSITINLGWGRSLPENCKVSHGAGFNAYPLRGAGSQWLVTGAQVSKTGGRHQLVCTQEHGTMAGRAIVREADVATNKKDPRWAPKMSPLDKAAALHGGKEADINKSLWTERFEEGGRSDDVKKSPYQWGMVIDLNACTGCSACIAGCVSENNIPMVGKIQVSRNREMFWIRSDRYFSSKADDRMAMAEDPQVASMPVPCMQCENAPCESVCPVAATTHSPDGLNDMVYNRCIGTRYCSNNCPYKV
ncbi:MAG: TAT-variant-translocated molybdopterin oxidoreductase, partial [Planctomycetes bacterium]|nr:TAT-variant-translocated molybdopterin oxidoreductase [Planctomycetota bacterium]